MIFDPKHKILILYSGRFFATLNNSCKSAGTLALLIYFRRHGRVNNSDSSFIFIISYVYTNLISAISTAKSCKDFSIFSIVVFEGLRLPVT